MVESLDEMHEQIDRGIIKAGLIIPPDFSQKMEKGEAQVAFILDGSDPTLASPALSAAQLIGQAFSIDVMQQKIARSGLKLSLEPVVDVRTSVLYNPDMNSSYFMVPGVIGMILFAITAIITATSVVRERERGTIEQLIITPIRPLELVIGKITPYVILSLFDAFEVIAVGHFWFGVPVRGSLLVIALACSTFLFSGLGIGLFASTVANTQQESMLTVFMTYLPAIFLSGFFYPIENMPVVLQITSYFVPLRYFLNIIRALLLKGVGLQMVQNDMIALVIFGFVIMAAAALRFRKRLD
jgi:ABC-2 type transport system permease protein